MSHPLDIVIIDSGVNPWHSHVQGVAGGISFDLDESGEVLPSDDYRDETGHGTAIAGVIRESVPQARLHAVRIFRRELEAPMAVLQAALEWAVQKRPKMIHLSLGTEREEYRPALEETLPAGLRTRHRDRRCGAHPRGPGLPGRVRYGHRRMLGPIVRARNAPSSTIPARRWSSAPGASPRPLPGLPDEMNFQGEQLCGRPRDGPGSPNARRAPATRNRVGADRH